jgi:hypothetical protein
MKLAKFTVALAAAALVAAPALAQAVFAPTVAPLAGDESELSEGAFIVLGVVAAGAVILAIVSASDDEDPVSN